MSRGNEQERRERRELRTWKEKMLSITSNHIESEEMLCVVFFVVFRRLLSPFTINIFLLLCRSRQFSSHTVDPCVINKTRKHFTMYKKKLMVFFGCSLLWLRSIFMFLYIWRFAADTIKKYLVFVVDWNLTRHSVVATLFFIKPSKLTKISFFSWETFFSHIFTWLNLWHCRKS